MARGGIGDQDRNDDFSRQRRSATEVAITILFDCRDVAGNRTHVISPQFNAFTKISYQIIWEGIYLSYLEKVEI